MLAIRSLFLSLGRKAMGISSRQIAADKKSYQDYQGRKVKYKTNPIVRTVWSGMTRVEHLVQIGRDIQPKLGEDCVVVCDRYLWDSIIDLAVLHQKNVEWLWRGLNRWAWRFVPQPATTFFMDIPPEEALNRKDDISSFEEIRVRASLYRGLAEHESFLRIDGCNDIAAIQNRVRDNVKSLLSKAE